MFYCYEGPIELFSLALSGEYDEFTGAVFTVSEHGESIRSAQGIATVSSYSFSNCPEFDVLIVPGGFGSRSEIHNVRLLQFIRTFYESQCCQQVSSTDGSNTFVLSVCTGAAILAAAGILRNKRATTNKRAFEWVKSSSKLAQETEWTDVERYVHDGCIVTSAGISAGCDASLYLIGLVLGNHTAIDVATRAEYESLWFENYKKES